MKAGIERLAVYVPKYYLDLRTLARARGVEEGKYLTGLGQERMAVAPPDEDAVTMGAGAGLMALAGVDKSTIDAVLFATESGIDQSKAGAIYIHRLLDLPASCQAFEIKQACCGSTAALTMALALAQQRPDRKVLVVASDIARYAPGSPGEPTQGAAAVAMLVSADPAILAIEEGRGVHTEDVMDFWRPNYREDAVVDGKYSIRTYLHSLSCARARYEAETGRAVADHARICFHMPFSRMADKALDHLGGRAEQLAHTQDYARITGNGYTASLYMSLASALENEVQDLAGMRIGFFSYGSGCMAMFFSGIVAQGYREQLHTERHHALYDARVELTMAEYETFQRYRLPENGSACETPRLTRGRFRLAGIQDHKRIYQGKAA